MAEVRFPNLAHKDYLGDGVYVGHDGYHIVLWLESTGAYGRDAIALEPAVLRNLEDYVRLYQAREASDTEETPE